MLNFFEGRRTENPVFPLQRKSKIDNSVFCFFSRNDNEEPTIPTPRRKVERSSSTRLQNAAKLLRTLSKSRLTKDSNVGSSTAEESSSKNNNHQENNTKAKKRSHSFHGGRNSEQKKLQRKESAARSVSTDWKR